MIKSPSATPDRWSLESWFTGFGAPDYIAFKEAVTRDLATLLQRASGLGHDTAAVASALVTYEHIGERIGHLSAFIGCLSAADATNEAVKADEAWLATLVAESEKLGAALRGTLATLPPELFEAVIQHSELDGAAYGLRRMREEGSYQMPAELESLAADLNVNGLHAWGRLYETLTGKMSFEMTFPDGHSEVVPMARRRALMSDPDRRVRAAAFEAGQKPWVAHADTLAAGLNGIAGARLNLYTRRGIPHFLDRPLFDGAITRASLDAMMEAIRAQLELPRRAIRRAARLQGTSALHYFDLEAPQIAAPEEKPLSWDDACATVQRAFQAAYPKLGDYFASTLRQRWIEAEPRPGKRPGAFCTGSRLKREERMYLTFHGTVHDMVTLAHEAGHAWHSCVLRPTRSYAAEYPMTLAETASNFAEMILLAGLRSDPVLSPAMKAYLLDQEMLRSHAYLINIPMRFEFEQMFYTERARGEVSISRLNEMMTAAQQKLYGNTLLPDGTDPMFWASKMHFFISSVSFYNFPYAFGYLLSQALFARFQAEGRTFLPRYEAFLAQTGSATCEEVARRTLGVDLTTPDFWVDAMRAMEPALQDYEQITGS